MSEYLSIPCTAFDGTRQLACGALIDVALAVRVAAMAGTHGPILTFDDASGAVIDFDLRGSTAEIVARLTRRGGGGSPESGTHDLPDGATSTRSRGRPKLGVVAREVTLLPRHWEWLGTQAGGASQALRRLIDDARRADGGRSRARLARERAYRFLSALAGDLPGFEDVIRALFSGDGDIFADRMGAWPADVRAYALKLAQASLGGTDLPEEDKT